MGKRVHVAKCYKIEWGSTEAFNWAHEDFYNTLKALGGDPCWCGTDGEISDDFECSVEDYDDAIANLEVYIADQHLLSESDKITETLEGIRMTAEELLDIMKRYRNEADVYSGYLHFSAF